MLEIEFSIIEDDPREKTKIVAQLLEEFQEQQQIQVRLRGLTWEEAWPELFTYTMVGKGPDVSQVGSTWVSNLVAMNALRPFTPDEVASMGGAEAFIKPDWQSAVVQEDTNVWAIPWYSYLYVLCYRRDLLVQAGVNEQNAFINAATLADTVNRLRAAGVEVPLALPTQIEFTDLLHIAAGWIWDAGGSIVSDDGKQILFSQPEALAGLQAFFELYRSLPPSASGLTSDQNLDLFYQGRAAAIIIGANSVLEQVKGQAPPEVREHIGAAIPSRTPWFGGENLAIWRHTQAYPQREQAAVALVNYLSGHHAQVLHTKLDSTLPTRLDTLADLTLVPESLGQTFERAVRTGRAYPPVALWRRIEFQVGQELVQILNEVQADTSLGIAPILQSHLDPLARRLDLMLK